MSTLRIAVVEPYLGGSHRAWAEGYAAASSHDVEVFGLPGTHWKWRMQGGHVTLAPRLAEAVDRNGPFDAVLATSTTNLPGLLGCARDALAGAAVVLYLHENQLTFPRPPHEAEDLTYAMINWTSMVVADRVVFNSEFHRRDWFGAVRGFLRRMPDQRHDGLVDAVEASSLVLPVGVDVASSVSAPRERGRRPVVLWNHRWEYDTGPDEFADAIDSLVRSGVEFDVALAGERFTTEPAALGRLRELLGDRLVHDGHAAPDEYRRLLGRSDVVVSTAVQEFFGISITEAVAAGAFPVVPNRLVYPERIPPEHHADCLYDGADGLVERLRWALTHREAAARIADALTAVMAACDWSTVAPAYDALLTDLAVVRSV